MNQNETITIPSALTRKGDLIIIPRKEYEALLKFKQTKYFSPSLEQKRALLRAEKNLQKGKTLSYHELVSRLGITS